MKPLKHDEKLWRFLSKLEVKNVPDLVGRLSCFQGQCVLTSTFSEE